MANEQNLKPCHSKSVARERGALGGKKSGVTKRRKKLMRETLKMLLSMPSDKREGMCRMESSCIAQVLKAEDGDLSAFLAIRDTIGEKPTERQEVSGPEGAPIMVLIDGGDREPA